MFPARAGTRHELRWTIQPGAADHGNWAANLVAISGNWAILPVKIMKMKEAALCLLAAGALLAGPMSRAADEVAKPGANLDLARQLNQAFVQVAEEVSPAVVVITVVQRPASRAFGGGSGDPADELPPELRRFLPPERTTGEGSGVIIRGDGFILTNGHVVENAERIRVRLRDGRTFPATVRGVDTPSDVAVIKIEAKDLPVAKLADSAKTRVGEFAIAIGAPFALDYSVTFGHVSAKDRANILDEPENPTLLDQSFLQTDANINPGNSGGPLVNIDGEVIGINTLIRGLHTGIGFAIPANLAREISDKLISDGKYTRSWLGISITSLREDTMFRELEPGLKDGVVVREVMPEGPAAKSPLRAADVITAVDGTAVVTSQQLKDEIRSKTPGKDVTLSVFRQSRGRGFNTNIVVQPGEWKPAPAAVETAVTPSRADDGTAGLKVGVLRRRGQGPPGVVITAVAAGSMGDGAGLTVGDVIVSVGSQAVTTPKQFFDLLKAGDTKKGILLNFTRQGSERLAVLRDNGD
jgi:serine protease Do